MSYTMNSKLLVGLEPWSELSSEACSTMPDLILMQLPYSEKPGKRSFLYSETKQQIYEIHKCSHGLPKKIASQSKPGTKSDKNKPEKCRSLFSSAFVNDSVLSDGSIIGSTRLDPLLLLIAWMHQAYLKSSTPMPLEELQNHILNVLLKVESSEDIATTFNLCFNLPSLQKRLTLIYNLSEGTHNTSKLYVYDPENAKKFLRSKWEHMKKMAMQLNLQLQFFNKVNIRDDVAFPSSCTKSEWNQNYIEYFCWSMLREFAPETLLDPLSDKTITMAKKEAEALETLPFKNTSVSYLSNCKRKKNDFKAPTAISSSQKSIKSFFNSAKKQKRSL